MHDKNCGLKVIWAKLSSCHTWLNLQACVSYEAHTAPSRVTLKARRVSFSPMSCLLQASCPSVGRFSVDSPGLERCGRRIAQLGVRDKAPGRFQRIALQSVFSTLLHLLLSSLPLVLPRSPSHVFLVFVSFLLSGEMLSGKIIIYCVCVSLLFALVLSVSLHTALTSSHTTHTRLFHNGQECHWRSKSCLVDDSLFSLPVPINLLEQECWKTLRSPLRLSIKLLFLSAKMIYNDWPGTDSFLLRRSKYMCVLSYRDRACHENCVLYSKTKNVFGQKECM